MSPKHNKVLFFLLLVQFIGLGILFPYHAFQALSNGSIQGLAILCTACGILALVSVWQRRPWALWAVVTAVSLKLTIDLYAWATYLDRSVLMGVGTLVNLAIIGIAFRANLPASPTITRLQKFFYGCVLTLAALIGIWGLFFPANALQVLPFMVPPLHARFLGSMYLSGATFMALNILATQWAEVRVVTPMIAIWTGMLGIVSLFHLEAFDWSRIQVWIWFIAYIGFPLVALWIAWHQRSERQHPSHPPLSRVLQIYLCIQGGLVTLLALCLLVAPVWMVSLWPWKITPVLAHIYSAPFLSYGLGSLYAISQRTWAEVRIVIYATLVFTVAVLIASLYHAALFDFSRIAPWLWFSGFALTSIALGLFGSVPSFRSQSQVA
jgi:hypothetical protein